MRYVAFYQYFRKALNIVRLFVLFLLFCFSFSANAGYQCNYSTGFQRSSYAIVDGVETCNALARTAVPSLYASIADLDPADYDITDYGEQTTDGTYDVSFAPCSSPWYGGITGRWSFSYCIKTFRKWNGNTGYFSLGAKINTYQSELCDCTDEAICEFQERNNNKECWPDGASGSLAPGFQWSFGNFQPGGEGQCPSYSTSCTELAPDADGDGIPDSEDSCPNDSTNRCNDNDGDGVLNAYDSCPNDPTNSCNDLPQVVDNDPATDQTDTTTDLSADISTNLPGDLTSNNTSSADTSSTNDVLTTNNNTGLSPATADQLSDINSELNAQSGLLEQIAKSNTGPCNPAQPDYYDCQLVNSGTPTHTQTTATSYGEVFTNFYNSLKNTQLLASFENIKGVYSGSGSCPALSIDLSMTLINRVVSTTVHCDITEVIRPIIGPAMLILYSILVLES